MSVWLAAGMLVAGVGGLIGGAAIAEPPQSDVVVLAEQVAADAAALAESAAELAELVGAPSTTVPSTTLPPSTTTTTTVPPTTTTTVPPTGGFTATFDTPSDFYDRFDYGFSGFNPARNGNFDRIVSWQGDHDEQCDGPTTQRTIDVENGDPLLDYPYQTFDPVFWHCVGHLMTGVNVVGYNIAWFAPKGYFGNVQRVCYDLNVTDMSSRKWTQVLFVSPTDATAHPSPQGSHGYDLGYTNPMFRGQPGTPSAEILPVAGDLAGIQDLNNGQFRWFQDQDVWTQSWAVGAPINGHTDKAGRYQHCFEQSSPGTITITQERPDGSVLTSTHPGTIPQGPVRVVFQDDNYNAPKGDNYDPNVLTWHWDNIVIETG